VIHVDRVAVPASLTSAASKGVTEMKDAIKAVKAGADFEFKAYKGDDVVAALRAMFNKKCAYCEFNYAAGGPEDVEHFRPKGGVIVNGKLEKPGYYWLAAEWSNLLPSCIDCNRKREKDFTDGTTGVSGKANLFPVADEARRWRSHRGKNREEPLLLNPCDDQPEQHLEFLDKGLVRPALDAAGNPSRKGDTSIEVYGLTRQDLVEQREKKQKLVRLAIERARRLAAQAAITADAGTRAFLDEEVKDAMREARTHLDKSEPYLAAARAVFREFELPH
jgi:uncharacterized protein (TIGR02646 family)